MNAVFWGVTALCIMRHKDALDTEETIEYVMSCWDEEAGTLPSLYAQANYQNSEIEKGAFGAHPGHDAHILSTLSAIQVLVTHDALARIDVPRVVNCTPPPSPPFTPPPLCFLLRRAQRTITDILGLQQPSGIFAGDSFGETDTRFLYCAVSALSLLGALDRLDRERTVSYLASCRNFDGGFGRVAGAESHAGQGRYALL
jgi:geranylgeranyl transferase type-2 subunit beta